MCKPFSGVCEGGLRAHTDSQAMNLMCQRESQTFLAAAMYMICKLLVELLRARTNTIFHQLKAGHLPNAVGMMPSWLKKTVC